MRRVQLADRWTLIWAVLVAVVSLLPQSFKRRLGTAGIFHGWVHGLVFAITAILVCRRNASFLSQLLRSFAVIMFGAVIECLQHAFYGSVFEWLDVMIDAAGVLMGLAFALWTPIRVSGTPAPR
ncbi:MAG: VanZ family protein [Acidobacteriota bacterium]|nr:VanZ family protein [Acidobacteriota bacterium]